MLENSEMEEFSPITDLANNLGDASFGFTSRRKLSLPNENSPHPKKVLAVDPQVMTSTAFDTPTRSVRLVKTSLKCTASGTPMSSQANKRVHPRRLCDSSNTNENLPPTEMQISPPKNFVPSPSKFSINKRAAGVKCRIPLEDQDTNSQDSGVGVFEDGKLPSQEFRFAQPSGFAPRRLTQESPRRSMASNLFSSSSSESNDDGFMDFIMPLQDDDNSMLPPGLNGLISEPIINNPNTAPSSNPKRPMFRRCISENIVMSPLNEDSVFGKRPAVTNLEMPTVKRHKPLGDLTVNIQTPTRGTLFDYGFKKLKSPLTEQLEMQQSPRCTVRHSLQHSISADSPLLITHRHKLKHSYSESDHDMIKSALARSIDEDLIGDLTRPFALPIMNGTHRDLKYISSETLAMLMNGEFKDVIESFEIIDCRFPYEYEGGHIKGAKNMYTRDQVMEYFICSKSKPNNSDGSSSQAEKRNIVIFHCEFSSERGPTLSRFLRKEDRASNCYPTLNYPEMYLLHGGYKAFYTSHADLCEPCAYRKMVDCGKEELQHFRAKSRTWSGDNKGRALKRASLRLVI